MLGEIKVGLSPPNKERFFSSGKYREKIWGTPDIQNAQTPQRKPKKSFAYSKQLELDLQLQDLSGLQDCSVPELTGLVYWIELAYLAYGAPGGLCLGKVFCCYSVVRWYNTISGVLFVGNIHTDLLVSFPDRYSNAQDSEFLTKAASIQNHIFYVAQRKELGINWLKFHIAR